jgi:ABC-type cobalamin/Fe3+-siderophores transport system ATPase subunit
VRTTARAVSASGGVPLKRLFELRDAGVRYGSFTALQDVSLQLGAGEFVAIAGPNGAGKSTLLGVMAGLRPQFTGECLYDGRAVREWTRAAFARRVSVVPQTVRIDFPFTAEQVVLMGRTAHADSLFESDADAAHVERAMSLTGTAPFRHRDFRSLSGGEKQRVIVASALAQTPESLLLDEPATHLDIEHQISLYRLLRSLADEGVLVVTITHDLNLAASYATRVVLIRGGALSGDGKPADVLRAETIREVFRVDAVVHTGPGGRPWIQYAL